MEAPINNQIIVADFIATEWKKISNSNQLLIHYEVFKRYGWLDKHTQAYEEYYSLPLY